MNTAIINIKTDPKVKSQAKAVASELGFNLSTLINSYLREFVRTKSVSFSLNPKPTDDLIKILKESDEDIKAGRVSPSFTKAHDAIKWLDDPKASFQNGDIV